MKNFLLGVKERDEKHIQLTKLGLIVIFLSIFFLFGCTDTIVEVEPITDTSLKELPIDGWWVGDLRDDDLVTWHARFHIGIIGNERYLKGLVERTIYEIDNMMPFPVQNIDVGMIVHPDTTWFTTIFVTGIWMVHGRLIGPDTMEISLAGTWPRNQVFTLYRATGENWPLNKK